MARALAHLSRQEVAEGRAGLQEHLRESVGARELQRALERCACAVVVQLRMARHGVQDEHLDARGEIRDGRAVVDVRVEKLERAGRVGVRERRPRLDCAARRAVGEGARDLDCLVTLARGKEDARLDAAELLLQRPGRPPVADLVERAAQRLQRAARAVAGIELREGRERGDLQPHGEVTRRPRCIRGARKRLDRRGIAPQVLSPAEREQRGRRDGEGRASRAPRPEKCLEGEVRAGLQAALG